MEEESIEGRTEESIGKEDIGKDDTGSTCEAEDACTAAAIGAAGKTNIAGETERREPEEVRKKISVLIPCYNEEDNVGPISDAVIEKIVNLEKYDYELVFIDNCSQDATRERIEALCAANRNIKAIFNARNYGQFSSPYYGLLQTTGDCTITICCDFQDPPEIIPRLIAKWEEGAKVVCMVKTSSKENRFIRGLRSIYYRLIHRMSDVEQIEHFTGSGLYDRTFLDVLRTLDEPAPFMRGLVAELGFKMTELPYEQAKRRAGKTSNNFSTLYDGAMLSFTSYTKTPLRAFTFLGFAVACFGIIGIIVFAALMGCGYAAFSTGLIISFMALFMGIAYAGIGILGEYVITLRSKVTKRPLVVEEKRINFE